MLNFQKVDMEKVQKAKENGFKVSISSDDTVTFVKGDSVYIMNPNGSGIHYSQYYGVSVELDAQTMEVYLYDKKRNN